jgi:hypothetical protein
MTVLNDNPPRSQYIGDGVTEFFAYTFEVKDYSDIIVAVDDVPTAFVRGATGITITPAPADLAVIDMVRSTTLDQLTDFTAQEAFPPKKTEDAVDKLILLKQEIGFNFATMNLLSQPFLDNVTLVNDVGTDAVIPLWDTLTGVFSGLVSTTIPASGAVVAKPLDFVYMQYGGPETQILTTTVYPLETAEALQLSIAISDETELQPVPVDDGQYGFDVLGVTLTQTLISTEIQDDDGQYGFDVLGVTLSQILIAAGPFDDDGKYGFEVLGVTLEEKLVTVYAPDEALQLSIALDEDAWTLTPV